MNPRPSSFLRLRQADPVLAEFKRPFGQTAPALGAFFRRCGRIDHPLDCLRGELLSAQPPSWLADGLRRRFDLQPELDQAADGFGAAGLQLAFNRLPGRIPFLTLRRNASREPCNRRRGRVGCCYIASNCSSGTNPSAAARPVARTRPPRTPEGARQRGGEVCRRASPPHPFSWDPPPTDILSARPQLEHSNFRASKPRSPAEIARDFCRAP
jgi:hypothetical protein